MEANERGTNIYESQDINIYAYCFSNQIQLNGLNWKQDGVAPAAELLPASKQMQKGLFEPLIL